MICIFVIALESTSFLGADHTSGPLRALFEAIFGAVSNFHWDEIHHLIRKSGHFLGYGTIGLFWLRAWRMTAPNWGTLRCAALSLLGTALIASSDELHQTFLPNRTGMFSDVILDCCGATLLLCAAYVWLRAKAPKNLERAA